MQKHCEVCERFRPGAKYGVNYRVTEVEYDARPVHLCVGHARIAENSGVTTFQQLRELYGAGRRSFVPRRDPHAADARAPSRNTGRRASDGQSPSV